jgi:ABC-type multidrug transport system fused ATPase/permease subunit
MQTPTNMPEPPNVIEAGRVLATLDDWRAVMFMFGFIIIFLLVFTIWREWAMQSERKLMATERGEMRELARSFADSASKVSDSLSDLSTKIAVLGALTARAEASIAQADASASERTNG